MYRFGDDSELKALIELEVWQVCLGQYETQLCFSKDSRLVMEGAYVHEMPSNGREVHQARSTCGPNELYRLLGQSVSGVRVVSPEEAQLTFSNGDALRLLDDSDQYESFLLTLPDRQVVV